MWFVLGFFAVPFFAATHFYFVHRVLHWRPLYRLAHALHHRHYDCNYGTPYMPCDRWFGTEHDGTPEAMAAVRRRRLARAAS